jgi:transcriptional regulator with XRE-family HTH domain
MSNISNTIDELMKEHKLNASELAARAVLIPAHISRLKSGAQVYMKPKTIIKLAAGFCPNKQSERFVKTHARLLFAHLHDECSGAGAKYITIKMPDNPNLDAATRDKIVLPPGIQKNLDVIREQITKNRVVREIIRVLAKDCEQKASLKSQEK